jgi:hypothetical protein
LLETVLADDAAATKRLFQTGMDVNMVMGPWAENILCAAWRAKGKFGKQNAPFFICSHDDESLRPRLLHLAIYFNRQKCIRTMVELNVDSSSRVWMSDVKERGSKLLVNEKRIKKPENCVIKTPYLPQECCDKQVFAIVEGMLQRSETKWKALSLDIEKVLSDLLLGQWFKEDTSSDPLHILPAVSSATAGTTAETLTSVSIHEQMTAEHADDIGRRSNASVGDHGDELVNAVFPSAFALQLPKITNPRPSKKHLRPTMSPKPDIPDWRQHPIVSKLEGQSIVVKGSVSRKEVRIMGQRTYWLESRSWHVAEIARKQQELELATIARRTQEAEELREKTRYVSNAPTSDEDSLVPAYRSQYDLPVQPEETGFALPGHGIKDSIAARKHKMRALLNKRFHIDIDD